MNARWHEDDLPQYASLLSHRVLSHVVVLSASPWMIHMLGDPTIDVRFVSQVEAKATLMLNRSFFLQIRSDLVLQVRSLSVATIELYIFSPRVWCILLNQMILFSVSNNDYTLCRPLCDTLTPSAICFCTMNKYIRMFHGFQLDSYVWNCSWRSG